MIKKSKFYRIIMMVTAGVVLGLLGLLCDNSSLPVNGVSYTLITSASNGNITKKPDKDKYQGGETVTLTAVANSGYIFSVWSGDASGTNILVTLTMNGNKSVTANFTAGNTEPVSDIDGNIYQTVRLGNQVWTVENLRTTKYNDGTAIPLVTEDTAWGVLITPGYCYYNKTTNADSIKKFGAFYNWYTVDPVNTKKLAPAGWHIPTYAEWDTLANYLIAKGYNWDGTTTGNKIAKSLAAMIDWGISTESGAIGNDLTKNNRSGFSALPGGCRDAGGGFYNMGDGGGWWSVTEFGLSSAYSRSLHCSSSDLYRSSSIKSCGFSARLVRD